MFKKSMMVAAMAVLMAPMAANAWFFSDKDETVELKVAIVQGMTSNEYNAFEAMKEHVEAATDGAVTIKIYGDSQLGNDIEVMEQMTAGTLDIGIAELGRFGVWSNELSYVQFPYAFADYDHITRFLATPYWQAKEQFLQDTYSWRIMDYFYAGARNTSTSAKPINSVADMANMKIRVPNAEANMVYVKGVDASPTPMAFTEVYLALKTNAVDGQENPLSIIDNAKLYEVQPYLAMTKHIINGGTIVLSQHTWDRIPSEYHDEVQAGAIIAGDMISDLYFADDANLISKFQENGVTITYPPIGEFMEAFVPVKENYKAKSPAHAEMVNAIDAAL